MARKKFPLCKAVDYVMVGDYLIWDNTGGKEDCVITKCSPPLQNNMYEVFAGETTSAYVVGPAYPDDPDHYHYHCKCGDEVVLSDPRLIVK